ncbi:MAG: hypothetical protein ACRDHG_04450 [Anaerolineales bacterium]
MRDAEKPTSVIGRAIALLVGLAFVVSLPLTLLALAWGRVLFSPEQMTDILAAELVDSGALQRAAVEAFLTRSGPEGAPNPESGSLDFLDRHELDRLVETLFPPEWAHDQMRANVEILYAWIDSDMAQPAFRIDIQPLKDRLQAGGAEELVTVIVDSWPLCSPEQLQQLEREGFVAGELLSVTCEPPDPLRSRLINSGTELLLDRAKSLPSSSLISSEAPATEDQLGSNQLKRGLRFLRELSDVGWMLPTSLLGLIVALAVRAWPALLRWWGAPLSGAGLSSFITLIISRGILDQARTSEGLRSVSGGFFEPILQNVIGQLLDIVGGRMFGMAVLLTVVGLALLLVGLWLGRRTRSAS